jgi:hypothetical protein
MASNFQRSYQLLFGADHVQLELEDDVRLELFLDNLQLHRHYSETLFPSGGAAAASTGNDGGSNKRTVTCNKYLKKIMKLLVEWECKLFNTQETLDTSMFVIFFIVYEFFSKV